MRHHRAHYEVNVMPFSMTMSSHEHAFHFTGLLSEGKPLVTGGLPSKRAINAEICFLCCKSKQVGQQIVKLPVL